MSTRIYIFFLPIVCALLLCGCEDEEYPVSLPESCSSKITGRVYHISKVIDFIPYGIEYIQSCPLNKKSLKLFLLQGGSIGTFFDLKGDKEAQLSLPDLGHENDAYINDDILYTIDGNVLAEKPNHFIYEYNFINKAYRRIECLIDGNDSKMVVGGICNYTEEYHIIVAYDYREGVILSGDKLYIYIVNKQTNEISLLFDTNWSDWFVQGATYVEGYLYVTTSMIPESAYNYYRGFNIYKFDVRKKILVDQVEIVGRYESEGIDFYYENGIPYLLIGVGSHQTFPKICQVVKLIAF